MTIVALGFMDCFGSCTHSPIHSPFVSSLALSKFVWAMGGGERGAQMHLDPVPLLFRKSWIYLGQYKDFHKNIHNLAFEV